MRLLCLAFGFAMFSGCGSSDVDELDKLRARLCECPTLSCANDVRAKLEAWKRKHTGEPSSEVRKLEAEIARCDARFSM